MLLENMVATVTGRRPITSEKLRGERCPVGIERAALLHKDADQSALLSPAWR